MESTWEPQARAQSRPAGIIWPVGGFWETTKSILLEPKRFFSRIPNGAGYLAPLLFALFWGVFAAVFKGNTYFGIITFDPSAWLISVAVAPVVTTALALVCSGVLHGMISLWPGGSNAGFRVTFQVWCYASAAYVLYVIPFVGPELAGLYALFLTVIGLRVAHSAPIVRAIGIVLTAFVALVIISGVLGGGLELSDRTLNILLP